MYHVIICEKYIVEVISEYVFVQLGGLCDFYGNEYDIELCL